MNRLDPVKFIKRTGYLCGFLLLCTMLLCLFVDPFSLFNLWSKPGWNEKKFSYFMREAFIKPYQIEHQPQHPDTILLGNSVANTGFDLTGSSFSEHPAYSMGMAGMGIYGNFRILQNLDTRQHIIWLVDFWNFLGTNTGNNAAYIENSDFSKRLNITREGNNNHGKYLQRFRDGGLALFSWDALIESALTIKEQGKQGWYLLQNGQWGGEPAHAGKSQQKAFQYMEKILIEDLQKAAAGSSIFSTPDGFTSLQAFELALRWIYSHNQNVVLVIPPAHARWYEILFMQGRWQDYRHWKQQLVQLNEFLAQEYHRQAVPLRDFSAYNAFTTEAVPEWQDKSSRIRYFSDNVHFSRELGSLLLQRLGDNSPTADDWGILLTSSSLTAQLERMEQQHWRYIDEQPTQWQNLRQSCLSVLRQDASQCLDPEQQKLRYGNH